MAGAMHQLLQQLPSGQGIFQEVLAPDIPFYLHDIESFFVKNTAYKQSFFVENTNKECGYRQLANKEIFMIRNDQLPPELLSTVHLGTYIHGLACNILTEIAYRLSWQPSELLSLIEPFEPNSGKNNASILRLSHYYANLNDTINTDAHQDLGLLTFLCPTNNPALETYHYTDHKWVPIEKEQGQQDVIVLVGESLSLLSNQYYLPCTHRIRTTEIPRYAIVYHLRLKADAVLNSAKLSNDKTGNYQTPFHMTAAQFISQEKKLRGSVNGSY